MRYYLATTTTEGQPASVALVTDDGRSYFHPSSPGAGDPGLTAFMDPQKYGEPEVWSYNTEKDSAVCPVTCNDLKAWAAQLGNPTLPELPRDPSNPLLWATWTMNVYFFLSRYAGPEGTPPTAATK